MIVRDARPINPAKSKENNTPHLDSMDRGGKTPSLPLAVCVRVCATTHTYTHTYTCNLRSTCNHNNI